MTRGTVIGLAGAIAGVVAFFGLALREVKADPPSAPVTWRVDFVGQAAILERPPAEAYQAGPPWRVDFVGETPVLPKL